jgi:hypothetical protein
MEVARCASTALVRRAVTTCARGGVLADGAVVAGRREGFPLVHEGALGNT